MRYDTEHASLIPHQYIHDLVAPASYLIVKPKKGHSTTFRIKFDAKRRAVSEARRRGFEPLYIVNAKPSAAWLKSSRGTAALLAAFSAP